MTHKLSIYLRTVCCSLFMLLLGSDTYASHLVGADMYYTHVSGNTYTITVVLYGDCGAASAAAFSTLPYAAPQVCVYNGNTYTASVNLAVQAPDSGIEITPLCPGDTSQCMSTTSTIPGVKKFVYSGTYTLPDTSSVWRFLYDGYNGSASGGGRAAAITNLSSPGSTIMQLVDTLNNTVYYNSSPDLTVTQQTYFCLDQPNNYNPTAVDPDGDSLLINLTNPTNGTESCGTIGGPVTYQAMDAWPGTSVSATAPLQCAYAYSVNPSTGAMSFYPNVMQRGVVVYNIEERRGGTTFVGTSQREMSVIVITCTSTFPCVGGGPLSTPVITDQHSVSVFPNPTYDELTIKMDEGAYSSFTICNNIGQTLRQQKLTAPQTEIDVKTLPAGVFYITFKGNNGTSVQKFVKW